MDDTSLVGPILPSARKLDTPRSPPVESSALVAPDLPPRRNLAEAEVEPASAPVPWTITLRGVGALRVRAKLREPPGGFESRYLSLFYGEAQPLEGFQLDDPPVLAAVTGGPFASWGAANPEQTPPTTIKTRAIALASAGELSIEMLVITDSRPKTTEGVAVGDDYLRFAQAYPSAKPLRVFMGLWEEPSCVVTLGTLWFFFDRCESTPQTKLIRIVVRPEGSPF